MDTEAPVEILESADQVSPDQTPMTIEEARLIAVSYCIGDRSKYHTCDTIRALLWALDELDRLTEADQHREECTAELS